MRHLVAFLLISGCSRAIEAPCQPSGIDNCCAEIVSPGVENSVSCRASLLDGSVIATAQTSFGLVDIVVEKDRAIARAVECESNDIAREGNELSFSIPCGDATYAGTLRIIATYPR
jgi:hypothetical protein